MILRRITALLLAGVIVCLGHGCQKNEGKIIPPHYTYPPGAKLQVAAAGGGGPAKSPSKPAKKDEAKKNDASAGAGDNAKTEDNPKVEAKPKEEPKKPAENAPAVPPK